MHSSSGDQIIQSHFDYRDPYMIRSQAKDNKFLMRSQESKGGQPRKKANSYTLNYNHHENNKSKTKNKTIKLKKSKEINKISSKLGKKINLLKSKKNSIKRSEISQSKIKKEFGGFPKKMKIRLEISQKIDKFNKKNEPVALKSCSMKNTISKFHFDFPLESKNFEFRPKFKETNLKLQNEAKREKSINLIYKGKSKLKRNHTTKMLRNISYYQENNDVEGKYALKKSKFLFCGGCC
jgi:hypothetical protein